MIIHPERTSGHRSILGPELVYTLGGSDREYYVCRSITESRYGQINAELSVGYIGGELREDTFEHSVDYVYRDFILRPLAYYRKLVKLRSALTLLQNISDPIEIYEVVASQEI
jgi:hypothetical protein